jgi:rhodanese-related sulfurtransferase
MKLFAYLTVRQSIIMVILSALIGVSINTVRSDRLPLIGNWSPEAQLVSADGKKMAISLEDAKKLFEAQKAVFLDARSPEDYNAGHIRGAKNLPWLEFSRYFDQAASGIAQDRTLIAYCDGETCHLSKELAKALSEMGFQDVRVLINGWSLWVQNNFPVQKGLQ